MNLIIIITIKIKLHHPNKIIPMLMEPPAQQDHSNADGTPSPIGGHTLTPTQNESNENHPNVNNTVASNLIGISSAGLVTSSPLTALKPQVPALTSSLFKFYKEPLIAHVSNW